MHRHATVFTRYALFLLGVRDHQLVESRLLILLQTATGRNDHGNGNGFSDRVGNENKI